MYYLSVNIILIILLYQCLTAYAYGIGNIRSHIPSESGCWLWAPKKMLPKMPVALKLKKTFNVSSAICADSMGQVYINHNSYFRLSCGSSKFASPSLRNAEEINVQCLGGNLNYGGKPYSYKDFICKFNTPQEINKMGEDDCIQNTEEKIKNLLEELNSDEVDQRMRLLQEFKDSPDCFIFMPTGGHYSMPIPLTMGRKPSIMHLRKDGVMTFKHNSYIKLSCTSEPFVRPVEDIFEITVKCLNGSLVEYNNKVYEYDIFRCNSVPKSTLKYTDVTCQDDPKKKILEIGFQTSDAFVKLYRVCFNMITKVPLYSWYHIQAPHFQPFDVLHAKPPMHHTDLFENVDPRLQYHKQRETVETLIDSKALASWYINKEGGTRRVLYPGPLVAQNSFSYPFEQFAVYYFENSVPQWGMFNRGIWRDVETLIMLKMSHAKSRHLIITGTYEIMLLHDVHRIMHPFFLSLPNILPVPQFVWLLDYNLDKNDGIVFIGRNNPYDNLRAKSKFTICPAIPCPGNLVRKRDYNRDLIYCCTKRSFEVTYGRIDTQVYAPYH